MPPIEAAPTAPSIRDSLVAAIETVAPEEPVPAQEPIPQAEIKAEAPEVPAQETEAEKAERLRNKDGTFAKGKALEKAAPVVEAPPKPKTPRPSSWKKELEAQWEGLAPEVQAYTLEREKQYQTGISTYKTEADRAKGVMGALAEFEPVLQQAGIPVDKWIANMGLAHRTLAMGQPQEKLAMVQSILAQNRIPAQLAIQDAQGNWQLLGQQQQPPPQPQFNPAELEERIQRTVDDRMIKENVTQQFKAFTEAKNEKGESKYPHYEAVKDSMAGLLRAGLAQDYPSAYEASLRLPQHAALWDELQTQQAAQKEAERLAAAKQTVSRARSQAVSVKSSTPSAMTQAAGPKGLREQLSEAFDSATSGRV